MLPLSRRRGKPADSVPDAAPLFLELLHNKPLREWSEPECLVWLSHIGLQHYRCVCRRVRGVLSLSTKVPCSPELHRAQCKRSFNGE